MVPSLSRAAAVTALLALPLSAAAQEFAIRPGVLIPAVPGTFFQNGAGAPSVTFNPSTQRYLMVFETRLPDTDPACPGGMWGIGAASSDNGINWVVRPRPIVRPQAGTWFSCVAAHPTVRINEDNGRIIVWFKGEQKSDVCANGAAPPAWGCDRFTGIGAIAFRPDGSVQAATTSPIITGQNIGFPKQVQVGAETVMTYEIFPDIHLARGTLPNQLTSEGIVLSPTPDIAWAATEYFNPAITCTDDPAQRYVGYFGGRQLTGFFIDLGGLGRTASVDGSSWDVSTEADFTWAGGSAFRHWDLLRVNDDDYVMYFSELDANGRPRIRVATTMVPNAPPAAGAGLNRKRCP